MTGHAIRLFSFVFFFSFFLFMFVCLFVVVVVFQNCCATRPKRVYSKRKEFAPTGSKFFPFRCIFRT